MKRLEFIEHRFRSIYSEPRDEVRLPEEDQPLPLEQMLPEEERMLSLEHQSAYLPEPNTEQSRSIKPYSARRKENVPQDTVLPEKSVPQDTVPPQKGVPQDTVPPEEDERSKRNRAESMESKLVRIREVLALTNLSSEEKVARIAAIMDR